jgi:hypothetical protein
LNNKRNSYTSTNFTSINRHRAAQPLSDRWRLHYIQLHTPAAGSRDEAVSIPSAHMARIAPSFAIPRQRCALSNTAQALLCCNILAVMRVQVLYSLSSPRVLIFRSSQETARREAAEIADEFPLEHAVQSRSIVFLSPRHRTVHCFIVLQPASQRQSPKNSPSRVQHSHLQRETVVKFGEGNGIVHKRPLHTTVYDTSPGAWYLQKACRIHCI